MKRLLHSATIVFALIFGMVSLQQSNAYAQRPSRGGGGGHISSGISRGSFFHSSPQSYRSSRSYSRPERPGYNYSTPRYRSNYRSYYGYRPRYYRYYNFYRPFLGFRLNILPYGYYPFYYGNDQYYYSGGLFYRPFQNSYEVVVPPVGANVPNLPDGAQPITINGTNYYEYKGVYYTQQLTSDNKTVYVVAGKDGILNTTDGLVDNHQVGDIVKQLPANSQEVSIKNETMYVSPDGVYYEQVVDGDNVSYQVIGRLKK